MDLRKLLLFTSEQQHLDVIGRLWSDFQDTGWEMATVSGEEEALEMLETEAFEILLTGPAMIEAAALDFMRRARLAAPRCFMVCLTSNGEAEQLRHNRSFREIQQYLPIPELNRAVLELLMSLATELRKMHGVEEELQRLSYFDGLTGLHNRRAFEKEMYRLDADLIAPVGIFTFDLDGLKIINDTLGHLAGDELIMRCAQILELVFQNGCLIARLGGDEFACLVPDATEELMQSLHAGVIQAVTDYGVRPGSLPLHISTGWEIRSSLSHNMDEIYRRADTRMYHEKLKNSNKSRNSIIAMILKIRRDKNIGRMDENLRMEKLIMDISGALNLNEEEIGNLLKLVQYYDIGKISISDEILHKPGPLEPEEAQEVRQYCEVGYRIAVSIPQLAPIAELILKQHEWWDGNGYPLGLAGTEIPVECRILAVIEAYGTMTTDRPYRKARSHSEAVEEIRAFAGRQFDPDVTRVFLELLQSSTLVQAGSR